MTLTPDPLAHPRTPSPGPLFDRRSRRRVQPAKGRTSNLVVDNLRSTVHRLGGYLGGVCASDESSAAPHSTCDGLGAANRITAIGPQLSQRDVLDAPHRPGDPGHSSLAAGAQLRPGPMPLEDRTAADPKLGGELSRRHQRHDRHRKQMFYALASFVCVVDVVSYIRRASR